MKKYITIAALLAAGSTLASANTINTDEWEVLTYKLRLSTDQIINQNNLDSGRAGFAELKSGDTSLTGLSGTDYSWNISFNLSNTPSGLPNAGDLLFSTSGSYNGSGFCIGLDNVSGDTYTYALRQGNGTIVYGSKPKIITFEGSANDTLGLTWDAVTKTLYFNVGNQSHSLQSANAVGITLSTTSISAVANGTTFWTNGGREKLANITVKALAIPEPSAFGLLAGLGALTLVGTRRRRRN